MSTAEDQSGRVVVVTGATSGVGREVAEVLARRGATVVLACRDVERATAVCDAVRADKAGVRMEVLQLDLASLASVRAAAERLRAGHDRVDVLVNNAGVMWSPRTTTEDGFELQFATNHLGPFAFTGLVLDRMLAVPGSRIVTVASPAHKQGRINFDDLQGERRYRRSAAYAQSKLANLLFTYELQRRLGAAGAETIALAAHPGAARSELNRHMPWFVQGPSWGIARPITHPVDVAAKPLLLAAVDPAARPGGYYGPDGLFEFKGKPALLQSTEASHNRAAQQLLWEVSEQLTNVSYDALRVS